MNRVFCLLMTLSALFSLAFAESGRKAGFEKSKTCIACHGKAGKSTNPAWPKLNGQNKKYLIKQLKAYKNGELKSTQALQMGAMASALSPADINDLATYYASLPTMQGVAKPEQLSQGQRLYRGGHLKQAIPACAACHGPQGHGNKQAGFPALAGQHTDYIISQLNAYHDGLRKNTAVAIIMTEIAQKMDSKQIKAVANYISGLH